MLVPFKVLRGLLKGACKDKTRHALNGVHLARDAQGKPSGCVTDGKTLTAIRWEEEDYREYPVEDLELAPLPDLKFGITLPLDVVKAAITADPKFTIKPILANVAVEEKLSIGKTKVVVTDLDTKTVLETGGVEARFPDYEPTAKKMMGEKIGTIDIVKLKETCEVLLATHGKDKGALMADIYLGEDKPIVFKKKADGVETFAAIMPVIPEILT